MLEKVTSRTSQKISRGTDGVQRYSRPYVAHTSQVLNDALREGKNLIVATLEHQRMITHLSDGKYHRRHCRLGSTGAGSYAIGGLLQLKATICGWSRSFVRAAPEMRSDEP